MLGLISLSSVSLPPFLSTKQRSSYTYVQTDSIKYDSHAVEEVLRDHPQD